MFLEQPLARCIVAPQPLLATGHAANTNAKCDNSEASLYTSLLFILLVTVAFHNPYEIVLVVNHLCARTTTVSCYRLKGCWKRLHKDN